MSFIVSRRAGLRLPTALYADQSLVFAVTIGVKARARVFTDPRLAQAAVEVLQQRARATGVSLHAFCVMPDHIHAVLTASPTCDVIAFVGGYKSLLLRSAWDLGYRGTFWQPRFWDHAARSASDVANMIGYVIENPVRAGLASTPREYRYLGPDEVVAAYSMRVAVDTDA